MPERVPTHRPQAGSRHREYDRFARDRESTSFYRTQRWLKVRLIKLRANPLCELCEAQGRTVLAEIVHHKREVRDDVHARLDLDNLQSQCSSCHSRLHKRSKPGDGSHAFG